MWIATPLGWFSVVEHDDASQVKIEAGVRSDLERLRRALLPEMTEIRRDGPRYAVTAPRSAWARALATLAERVTYDDFEAEVERTQGPWRRRLYAAVGDRLHAELSAVDDQERWLAAAERPAATPEPQAFDYGPALTVALEAAHEAATILRAEFDREGGPRGEIGSCPADEEAEVVIREHLRAAFPDWQFYGEETGQTGQPSLHHWLVDPNDGTSAFQRGVRGAAISIGLLRGTDPVLGVVLAPRPPIGDEDLLTWAEGQGPVRRNGAPVEPRWTVELTQASTVFVSQAADAKSETNIRLTAPARFHAVPSIAYRTALVAAGEADGAVSVSGANDFDYAGAHALLIGSGGVLLDVRGQPVQYAASGGRQASGGGALFAGAPAVAAALAQRPWGDVHYGRVDLGPFVWSSGKRIAPSGAGLDRAQGLWLGQLVGDALGAMVEFQAAAEIAARHPDGVRQIEDGGVWNTLGGQPTDDSELALSLARSLVRLGRYDVEAVAQAYADWLASGPFDVGRTTSAALGPGRSAAPGTVADTIAGAARVDSESNGGLMRISPLALLYWARLDEALAHAGADARLTHPSPVCQAANAAYVAALVRAVNGGAAPAALVDAALTGAGDGPGAAPVRDRLERAGRDAPPRLDGGQQGWVLHALQNAFHQLLTAPSFEEGLVRTVGAGGDTDTNGAIAGALLGAYHGAAAIPTRWRLRVLTCRPTPDNATHPRPRAYWPVDALALAERLYRLGHPDRPSP